MKAKQARNNSGSAKSKLRSRSALFLQDIKKSAVKDQFDLYQKQGVHSGNWLHWLREN